MLLFANNPPHLHFVEGWMNLWHRIHLTHSLWRIRLRIRYVIDLPLQVCRAVRTRRLPSRTLGADSKSGKQEWSPDSTSYRQFLHTGRRTTPAVHSSLPALFSRTIRTMRTTAWGSYDKRSLAAQLKFSLMLRHNMLLITHRVKGY